MGFFDKRLRKVFGATNRVIGDLLDTMSPISPGAATMQKALSVKATDDMAPDTLEDLGATTADEGVVVPMVFGTRKVPGNIMWYGNLTSKAVTTQGASGGKSGGGTTGHDVISGYKYYLDLWIGICLLPNQRARRLPLEQKEIELVSFYVDDLPVTLSDFGTYEFNGGLSDTYPTEPGGYASKLKGMAHIFLSQYYIGTSVRVPQIQFVVKAESDAPLTYPNFDNGVSPGAAIYDLLISGGATASDFNLASFNASNVYWHSLSYGLNFVINTQKSVRSCINEIRNYIDAALYVNSSNQWVLRAFKPTDTTSRTFIKKDFRGFRFQRQTWDDVFVDFKGNFVEADQDYTERTVAVRNQATRDMVGYAKQKTIALQALSSSSIASDRLTEIMKKGSYPAIILSFVTSNKYATVQLGDVVTISNSDYGDDALYRVIKIAYDNNEKNQITFTVQQFLESLIDNETVTAGGSSWQESRNDPSAATHSEVRVAPYFPHIPVELNPAFFVLASRAGAERGFGLITRDVNSTAYKAKTHYITTWAQYGVLQEAYSGGSSDIDDDVGVLYTPEREDPIFSTISRTDLFNYTRVALIGNEYIAFQTVTYVGSTDIRLTGCVRGIWGSAKVTHTNGSPIWIFNVADNLVPGITKVDLFYKVLPYASGRGLDPADTNEFFVNVLPTDFKKPPARILAVRSGSTVTLDVWRTVERPQDWPAPTCAGFQRSTDSKFLDADPMVYTEGTSSTGDVFFEWSTSSDAYFTKNHETDPSNFSYTQAGAHELGVCDRTWDYNTQYVYVDAADGVYENDLFTSGLRKIPHGMWGYTSVIEANNKLLNDTLLKVSGMLDVELTSLAGDDILKWNESSGKWTNVRYYAHFSTTTTSTTTAP